MLTKAMWPQNFVWMALFWHWIKLVIKWHKFWGLLSNPGPDPDTTFLSTIFSEINSPLTRILRPHNFISFVSTINFWLTSNSLTVYKPEWIVFTLSAFSPDAEPDIFVLKFFRVILYWIWTSHPNSESALYIFFKCFNVKTSWCL